MTKALIPCRKPIPDTDFARPGEDDLDRYRNRNGQREDDAPLAEPCRKGEQQEDEVAEEDHVAEADVKAEAMVEQLFRDRLALVRRTRLVAQLLR
ncbi:MAG TPA: hypothetical protein VHQ98_05085 [Gaiellaceae bacterium]|jgi:hypothetical protein|nr:hypothetical protein [Gaiellaceae bacterium]